MQALNTLLKENNPDHLLIALAAVIVIFLLSKWIVRRITRRVERFSKSTESWLDDVLADTLAATSNIALGFMAIYVCAANLNLSARLERGLDKAAVIALLWQAGLWGHRAILSWLHHRTIEEQARGNGGTMANLGIVRLIVQAVLWVVIVLLTLDNLGFNITALVASLGIGGVAIALALQNILSDLFASLSIALDKPFVVGDFIIVDEHQGTVKNVGLKTTRIQSLGGEELVFSNGDLLKSRIRNYKRMAERRVLFQFGITYGSKRADIETCNRIVREAIEAQKLARFDRVHFKSFGGSSLDFEVVYFMLAPDYASYIEAQQAINLVMLEQFAAAGIEFAFPTQTIHVASMPRMEGLGA